ncbi:MAG TPA: CocE/NonD family hydrolase, partial [Xanthomonadales bacterium]|nr:CocE/NonD family hydrolase [Xanthomonadales bacterium]
MKSDRFSTLMLCACALAAAFSLATNTFAGQAAEFNDVPGEFKPVLAEKNFTKRVEMIPMRDGVKLYTEIFIPKGAKNAPILMNRTPYNISARTERQKSPLMLGTLPLSD